MYASSSLTTSLTASECPLSLKAFPASKSEEEEEEEEDPCCGGLNVHSSTDLSFEAAASCLVPCGPPGAEPGEKDTEVTQSWRPRNRCSSEGSIFGEMGRDGVES